MRIEEKRVGRVVQVREEAETIPLTTEEEELEMGELEINQISHNSFVSISHYKMESSVSYLYPSLISQVNMLILTPKTLKSIQY